MTAIAYCWADGLIEITDDEEAPEGALTICTTDGTPDALFDMLCGKARFAKPRTDPPTLLVPGVPEADSPMAAVDALIAWRDFHFPDERPQPEVSN